MSQYFRYCPCIKHSVLLPSCKENDVLNCQIMSLDLGFDVANIVSVHVAHT